MLRDDLNGDGTSSGDVEAQREAVERKILDQGWTRRRLEQARRLLAAIDRDAELGARLDAFDRLRTVLREGRDEPDIDGHAVQRLVETVNHSALGKGATNSARTRPQWRRAWVAPVLALAAALGMAFTAGLWLAATDGTATGGPQLLHTESTSDSGGGELALSSEEVAEWVKGFRLVDETLGGRAEWVAFGPDNETTVGMPRDARLGSRSESASSRLRMISLMLREDHTVLARADVVLREGQTAQVNLPLLGAGSAVAHLAPADDGRLSVMVELDLGDGRRIVGGDVTQRQSHAEIGRVGGVAIDVLQQLGVNRMEGEAL